MYTDHKEQALQYIRETVENYHLTKEEVLGVLGFGTPGGVSSAEPTGTAEVVKSWNFNLVKILYFVGGLLVLLGIVTYVAMFWDDLGFIGQVSVTLGAGLIAYLTSIFLRNNEKAELASKLALLFSGLLLPTGVVVILNEADINDWLWASFWMAVGFFVLYYMSSQVLKNDVVRFLALISATTAYIVAALVIVKENPGIVEVIEDFFAYLVMVASVSYLTLSYKVFPAGEKVRRLNDFLVFFGTVGFLGASHALESLWVYVVPPAVLFFFYLSVVLRRRLILFVTTLFLIGYVARVTAEYFADVLSWPIALIFGGLLIISIGYASVVFGRKYLSPDQR